MGKSSSSKRKRSKNSSQGRTKKRSKTKRSISKKLWRHDDSDSYSSDDTRSPSSVSSSADDIYQGRRSQARSCARKDVKGTKRRARTRSYSSEDSRHLRKQKGARRQDDSKARKKTSRNKKKNKSRRNASVSSRSSGSWSCSTCQSSSSSSDESEYENHRGRSKRKDNNIRKLKNVKSGTKRSRYRSRSCSSCSRHDGSSDYQSEVKMTGGNISKRLRSIITLTKEDEGRELDWDGHKEEMIYDHDDYPSSKSNDSNDGENKVASAHQSHVAFDKKRSLETEEIESTFGLNIKTAKLTDSYEEGDDHYVSSQPAWDGIATNDAVEEKENENDICKASGNVNSDDLESILRQKALENLRRFHAGFQTNAKGAVNQKDTSIVTLKSPSTAKVELSETESPKDDGAQGDKRNFSSSVQKDEKIVDVKSGRNEYAPAKNNAYLPNHVGASGREKVSMSFGSGINKPKLDTSAMKQALSNATTAAVEMPASQVSNKPKLVNASRIGKHNATPVSVNDDINKVNNISGVASAKSSSCHAPTGKDVGLIKLQEEVKEVSLLENKSVSSVTRLNSSGQGVTVNNASSSTSAALSSHLATAVRDASSNKVQDDGKDGSQLEQKTMSVMRGGEMVQVSYKVYIPKKAPALARRQLKR